MPDLAETRVEFRSEDDLVRGTLYRPQIDGRLPAVALAHGWGMVAGGDLDDYARVIAAAGFVCLAFDFRRLGASDGQPRQEIDPGWQIEDYRSAVTFLAGLDAVDACRIGVWGTSYSGGHVFQIAATDARVKCVVAQVPSINSFAVGRRRVPPSQTATLEARFASERQRRQAGEPPTVLRQVGEEDSAPDLAYPGHDSYAYMMGEAARCPLWRNEVTLRSLELARGWDQSVWVSRIGPKPLMMIVADNDLLTPTDMQLDAFTSAREPKELVMISGGHYAAYGREFDKASQAARRWFATHLGQAGEIAAA